MLPGLFKTLCMEPFKKDFSAEKKKRMAFKQEVAGKLYKAHLATLTI